MAGRARAKALADRLASLAMAYLETEPDETPPTSLDYVCARIESGTTAKAIAQELSEREGFPVDYAMLLRHLRAEHGDAATDDALDAARVRASHSFAEHALQLVDEPAYDSVQVSRAAARARQRNWMAERYNPSKYGQSKGVSLSISVGSLHLDALRAVPARVATIVTGTTQPALQSGSHNSDDMGEVVAIHDVST